MKRIALPLFVAAFAILLNAISPRIEAVLVNNGGASTATKALWVFGGSVVPNPVSTVAGRNRLTGLSSAAGINALYVSVYQSTLSSSGRQMYQDADMAQLNAAAHGNAQEVWAAYGDVNWPTLGCTASSFPVLRMQEVASFNTANPSAKFDGVMLDVEPNPVTPADFQALLTHYQCMRSNLPATIKLGAAISAFWDDPVAFPVVGPVKPAYQHIIDLNLDSVVVMGYREAAGTATCPASNGLICLDKDEIAYASSIGKTGLVEVGLETLNVVPGQPETISFFEEGEAVMNAEAQLAANHFASESGYGGMAIHNYNAAYLSGGTGFPIPSVLGACSTGQNVDVESTGGTASAGYMTLKAAFDAINAATHTGTINIEICGDTNEGTATATLTAGNDAGTANYTAVTISPVGGAARTVSGASTASSPLIDLSGADNVIINGLNTGGNSLTISNTTVSASSNTSTIRFIADASNNVLTNTTVLGSSAMAAGTNGGNILFGASAISTGSDNNTISNCNIGPAGTDLPAKGFHFGGSTGAGLTNTGNVITNNNIFDYFAAGVSSAGIYVTAGTTDGTFSNNRFFQSSARTQTIGTQHSAIWIANNAGNGYQITGNTIGFANSSSTGIYSFAGVSSSSKFYPIALVTHGTTTATSIQGNVVGGISVSGPLSGTGTSNPFSGIYIAQGFANVGNVAGNTVGSNSVAGSISFSSTASTSEVYGIFNGSVSANVNISNNIIGGIAATNSSAGAIDLYGIRANGLSAQPNTIQNNTVGFAAAPLLNIAAGPSSNTYGIYSLNGAAAISGNTISNLTMTAGNTGTGTNASMIGLRVENPSSTVGNSIGGNTMRNITATNTGTDNTVYGLYYEASTSGSHFVERNNIYGLSVGNASSTSGVVAGIFIQSGSAAYQNNMIALGNGVSGGNQISGISETVGSLNNFWHNSIYIGGSGVVGSSATYAMQSTVSTDNREYRDNIFVNARSNGSGTGKHYAVRMGGTGINPAGLTINNNVYLANGTGGVFGFYGGLDRTTLAAWKTAIGQDAGSFSSDPQFVAPTGATPDLHINAAAPTVVEGGGANVGVADDFDGQTRSTLTPVDIGADAGNFTGIVVDNTAPVITYSSFGNTGSTANRVLAVTVSDNVAVASGGVSPRIYFRKNAGAYFSTQCAPTGGNAQSGTYDCTVDNTPIGGVTAGDVVGYFVIAQDTAGNVASNPSGVVAANVNSVTTPPTANTYTITASGPFVVNDGGEGTDASPSDGICETGTGNSICTLRAAIMEANALAGSDIINFGSGITTINTAGSLPIITTTMTIQGTGIVDVLGDTVNQVFNIASGGNLTLVNLKIQDGGGTVGAGLRNQSGGTVLLTNCEFSFNVASASGGGIRNDGAMTINLSDIVLNQAGFRGAGIFNGQLGFLTINDSNVNGNDNDPGTGGGGIGNDGTLTINRSLINGNLTSGNGGGIENLNGTGVVTIRNSTISFNSAFNANGGGIFNSLTGTINLDNSTVTDGNFAANGGGIFNDVGSTVNARSSIVAKNQAATSGPDVSGAYASPSFNLVGESDGSSGFVNGVNNNIVGTTILPVDPILGQLVDNGGPTRTYAVLPNSPALDKGNAFGVLTDQRVANRTFDIASISNASDGTDIGSFERTAPTAADVSLSGLISNTNGQGIRNIRVTISGGNLAEPRTALTGSFGYFRFDGLRAGQTYVVHVSGKRYVFAESSRVVTLVDELADVDFVGQPR